jgi:hypothetical protein
VLLGREGGQINLSAGTDAYVLVLGGEPKRDLQAPTRPAERPVNVGTKVRLSRQASASVLLCYRLSRFRPLNPKDYL